MVLWTGLSGIRVPPELVVQAGSRFLGQAFCEPSGVQRAPRVVVNAGHEEERLPDALTGLNGAELGRARVQGQDVTVWTNGSEEGAVAALRLGWNVAVHAEGGILVHGSAVAWNGRAILAIGPSTAGKSTFASLCAAAGATLLSDEILALLPDGRCAGTPFRSDLELPGCPGPFEAAAVVLLAKDQSERMLAVSPSVLVRTCLAETFPGPLEPDRSEGFRRLVSFLSGVQTRTLHFRKSPAAGAFVRDWVCSLPR